MQFHQEMRTDNFIKAFRHMCNFKCEKAMSDSLDLAKSMAAKSEETGKALAINYNYRRMPMFKTVYDMIQGGELGEIGTICISTFCGTFHHSIDQMWFLGGEIEAVCGMFSGKPGDEEDRVGWLGDRWPYGPGRNKTAAIRFKNGAAGLLDSSRYLDIFTEDLYTIDVAAERFRLRGRGSGWFDIVGSLYAIPRRSAGGHGEGAGAFLEVIRVGSAGVRGGYGRGSRTVRDRPRRIARLVGRGGHRPKPGRTTLDSHQRSEW